MKAKFNLYTPIEKAIIAVCILFIVFGVTTTLFPEMYRVIDGKRMYVVYPDFQAPLSEIIEIACDLDGNLYVLTNQSDCIVVFTPTGKVLYSYFFYQDEHSHLSMVSMKNNTVITNTLDVFNAQGWIREIKTDKRFYFDEIDNKKIYEKGSLTTEDKKGNVYKANLITAQITKIDKDGKKTHFAGDSFGYWLLNFVVPGIVILGIGVFGIYYTNEHMRKRHKDYLEYEEIMSGRNR